MKPVFPMPFVPGKKGREKELSFTDACCRRASVVRLYLRCLPYLPLLRILLLLSVLGSIFVFLQGQFSFSRFTFSLSCPPLKNYTLSDQAIERDLRRRSWLATLPDEPNGLDFPFLFSDALYSGNSLLVKSDMAEFPDDFGGVSSLWIPGRRTFFLEVFYMKNFQGRSVYITTSSEWLGSNNDQFQSVKIGTIRLPQWASKPKTFLVMAQHMFSEQQPANQRVIQLIATLVRLGSSVIFVCPFGSIHQVWKRQLEALNVSYFEGHEYATFDLNPLLSIHSFHAIFMYTWFWHSFSIPEVYISLMRTLSPESTIVCMTDDVHGRRENGIHHAFQSYDKLWQLYPKYFDSAMPYEIANREAAVYASSDVVVMVTERDLASLYPGLKEPATHLKTLVFHWTVDMTKEPVPTVEQVPPFEERAGMLFVGIAENPTNRLALEWFFGSVYQHLGEEMRKVEIILVGSSPKDGFSLLSNPHNASWTLTGKLSDEDLKKRLRSSRVLLSPIVTSTGVQTKNYLALCSGLPVVTTKCGAEGLFWAGQEQLFKESMSMSPNGDAKEFARLLTQAYTDKQHWQRLLHGGLNLARAQRMSNRFEEDVGNFLERLVVSDKTAVLRTDYVFPNAAMTPIYSWQSAYYANLNHMDMQFALQVCEYAVRKDCVGLLHASSTRRDTWHQIHLQRELKRWELLYVAPDKKTVEKKKATEEKRRLEGELAVAKEERRAAEKKQYDETKPFTEEPAE